MPIDQESDGPDQAVPGCPFFHGSARSGRYVRIAFNRPLDVFTDVEARLFR